MEPKSDQIEYSALILFAVLPTIFWILVGALILAPKLRDYHLVPITGFFAAVSIVISARGLARMLDWRLDRSHRIALGLLSAYGLTPLTVTVLDL